MGGCVGEREKRKAGVAKGSYQMLAYFGWDKRGMNLLTLHFA
jgi:hypothetical protein